MRASIFLISLIIISTLENTCPTYTCDQALGTQDCSSMTIKNGIAKYRLKECNETSQCDLLYGETNDKCTKIPTMQTKYPGEWCQLDSQCTSNLCKGKGNETFCVGRVVDEVCQDDMECDAGLFCNRTSHLCAKVANKGQTCNENLLCNAYTVCNKGTCVLKGSLLNGDNSTSGAACKSQHLRNGKCSDGPKLDRSTERKDPTEGPIFCPDEAKPSCTYTYSKGDSYTDRCVCGRNGADKMVCATGAGDINMDQVRIIINKSKHSTRTTWKLRRTLQSHAI